MTGTDLAGRVFVVTGAGNGIGRAVAEGLAERGARVATVDLREDTLRETAASAEEAGALSVHRAMPPRGNRSSGCAGRCWSSRVRLTGWSTSPASAMASSRLVDRLSRLAPSMTAALLARRMQALLP